MATSDHEMRHQERATMRDHHEMAVATAVILKSRTAPPLDQVRKQPDFIRALLTAASQLAGPHSEIRVCEVQGILQPATPSTNDTAQFAVQIMGADDRELLQGSDTNKFPRPTPWKAGNMFLVMPTDSACFANGIVFPALEAGLGAEAGSKLGWKQNSAGKCIACRKQPACVCEPVFLRHSITPLNSPEYSKDHSGAVYSMSETKDAPASCHLLCVFRPDGNNARVCAKRAAAKSMKRAAVGSLSFHFHCHSAKD